MKEIVPGGWKLESATCSDGSSPNNISLQKGENVTCTFTNKKIEAAQSCRPMLANSSINVVELGDGTGTDDPWTTIAPIVYYTKNPATVYGGNGFSIFLEDGDRR